MQTLGIMKFVLVTRIMQLHAKSDQEEKKLISLVTSMIQNQMCYVEVSSTDGYHDMLISSIIKRLPIFLKDQTAVLKNTPNVCLLHVIVLSTTDDVRLIKYEKERLCLIKMQQ